jgi:hypothetical protein
LLQEAEAEVVKWVAEAVLAVIVALYLENLQVVVLRQNPQPQFQGQVPIQ